MELDSHADTCVVGQNALITYNFETLVQVTGYDKVNAKCYKTVSAAVVYDDPMSRQMIFLEIHQARHRCWITVQTEIGRCIILKPFSIVQCITILIAFNSSIGSSWIFDSKSGCSLM